MAEIKDRALKVLSALSQMPEPPKPTEIGNKIGMRPIDVGRDLAELLKGGLAEKIDEDQNTWSVTGKGTEYLEEVEKEIPLQPTVTASVSDIRPPETIATIPSQSDLFRREGELLGVGTKKGDIRLEAIVKYVQRTANLDDLNSVWNALTEMGVANDVKKRWVKLYSQNLPNKQIPDELKEKLEAGQEERVSTTEKGEIPPKPKRFSIVGDQMIGDPEGDLNFKEALQLLAQQKGVPSGQVDPLATMLEAMKAGPETATAMMAAFVPLLTKEPPKHDDSPLLQIMQSQQTANQSQMQLLQQMIVAATEDKHKAELESLRAEIRTGQKPPESNEQIRLLTEQINSLRESLHQQQITTIQEQNKAMIEQMQNQMTRLEQQIAIAAQGKQVESKIGLLDKTVDKGASELTGIRQDLKGLATMMMARGELPRTRTPQERAKFAAGIGKAIDRSQEAKALADKLWFSGGQPPQE